MAARKRSSKGGNPPAEGTSADPQGQRRAYVRFAAMCRVDYESNGRPTFSFTRDLSSHGMFLRETRLLAQDERLTFRVHLEAGSPPVPFAAVVRYTSPEGAGVEFDPGQDEQLGRLRSYIEARVVQKFEDRLSTTALAPDKIADLAGYYHEVGRVQDALQVYRQGVASSPDDLQLREGFAVALVKAIGDGAPGAALVDELSQVVEDGRKLGASSTLDAAAEHQARFAAERADAPDLGPTTGPLREEVEEAREALARAKVDLERERIALKQRAEEVAAARHLHELRDSAEGIRKELARRESELITDRARLGEERAQLHLDRISLERTARELRLQQKSDERRKSEFEAREARLRERETAIEAAEARVAAESGRLAGERERLRSERRDIDQSADALAERQTELRTAENELSQRAARRLTGEHKQITRRPPPPPKDAGVSEDGDAWEQEEERTRISPAPTFEGERTQVVKAPDGFFEALQQEIGTRDEQIDDLRYELDFYMRRDAKAMTELDLLRRRAADDRVRSEALETERDTLEDLRGEQEQERRTHAEEVERLRQELAGAAQRADAAETERGKLAAEREALKTVREQVTSERADLRADRERLVAERAELFSDLHRPASPTIVAGESRMPTPSPEEAAPTTAPAAQVLVQGPSVTLEAPAAAAQPPVVPNPPPRPITIRGRDPAKEQRSEAGTSSFNAVGEDEKG